MAEDVRLNEARSGYTMCFPIPGSCAAVQSNMAATLNIDWLLDIACEANAIAGQPTKRAALLAGMDERVLAAPPGAALYHPYIFEAGERGPFLDPNARAQFSGLSSATTFTGMMRAVYEGLAFASCDCYLAMGSIPREVRLGGGAARSQAIRTILAAALDAKVRVVKREETGAAGAAMIAALQLGRYADMPACIEEWVDPYLGDFTLPDANLTGPYRELYGVYRSVRELMPRAWVDLAHIRQERRA
jgi:erythritol kinase